jgi:excisionase family DNA binding protein
MTIAEAATRLGICAASVRVLVREGAIPHHRPSPKGRRIVLEEADVEAYYRGCRQHGRAEQDWESPHVTLHCKHPFGRRA